MGQVCADTPSGGGGGWHGGWKRKGDDIGITEGVDSQNRDSADIFNPGQRLRRIPTGKISLQDRKLIFTKLWQNSVFYDRYLLYLVEGF